MSCVICHQINLSDNFKNYAETFPLFGDSPAVEIVCIRNKVNEKRLKKVFPKKKYK
jgi:hypothetical protein